MEHSLGSGDGGLEAAPSTSTTPGKSAESTTEPCTSDCFEGFNGHHHRPEIERVPAEGENREHVSAAEPVPAGEYDTIEEAVEAVERLSGGETPSYHDKDGIA